MYAASDSDGGESSGCYRVRWDKKLDLNLPPFCERDVNSVLHQFLELSVGLHGVHGTPQQQQQQQQERRTKMRTQVPRILTPMMATWAAPEPSHI
jgi:hypothetical protein